MDTHINDGILEEFRRDLSEVWQELPNKAFFGVLLVAWFSLFHFLGNSTLGYVDTKSLFGYMYDAYTSGNRGLAESEDAFALLIPFVVLALYWSKRRTLVAQDLRSWTPGLVLLSGGLLLHLFGFLIQQPRVSIVGFFVGVYGLTGLAWGPAWLRTTFFPFFLFGFCVPMGSLAEPITFRLRLVVSHLVEFVSHFFLAIDVIRDGTMLRDPTNRYSYEVAAACSGIRSLIATFALAIILAFVSLRTWWKRGLMVLAALPLALLGNLLRMLSIVIAAEYGGQEAGTYVHDGGPMGIFSMLPYIPAFIGLLILERYLADPIGPPEGQDGRGPSGRQDLARPVAP